MGMVNVSENKGIRQAKMEVQGDNSVGLSIILDMERRKSFFRSSPFKRTHRAVVGATLVGS